MISKEQIAADYQQIQDEICAALEATDGKAAFEEEEWEREGGGGGRTRIIQNGIFLKKAGLTSLLLKANCRILSKRPLT
jgi:coproporphyrinogen III oxidase